MGTTNKRSEAAKKAMAARDPEEVREAARRAILARWKDRTKITPGVLELARMASEQGATVATICDVLEIGREKFYRWMDTVPAFAAAVKEGRSIEHDRLVNKLVEVALSGNVAALCFALKSRHNYNDAGTGSAVIENKVSVNFVLPDAKADTHGLALAVDRPLQLALKDKRG